MLPFRLRDSVSAYRLLSMSPPAPVDPSATRKRQLGLSERFIQLILGGG